MARKLHQVWSGQKKWSEKRGPSAAKDDRVNDRVNFAAEVLLLVEKNSGLRSKDLAVLTGKSVPTISRFLKGLKDNGKIEFHGAPKNGGYFVK